MDIESSTVVTVMFKVLWIGPSNNGFSMLRFQVPGSMEGYKEIVREFAKEYGEAS